MERAVPGTKLLRIAAAGGRTAGLGLWERCAAARDPRLPPLLLIHGATLGGALFDLPRPGYSLMAALARAGRPVYALDVRGYGESFDDEVMTAPADLHPPFAGAEDAVRDIGAAIAFIRARCAVPSLDLVGFSWGTIAAARYAGSHPAQIRRLGLYAPLFAEVSPLWLARIADPNDRRRLAPRFGAYRLVTLAGLIERWNGDLPDGDPAAFREDGIAELVFDTLAALDPSAAMRSPRAFRCPNGAFADLVRVFNGEALYDPAKLSMPVLLVRGLHDTTATATDAQRLLRLIAGPAKRYRVIEAGSHFLCIERNRAALYDELNAFFGEEDA
jgi:pimeloyl-ACP methyl ester carboxylesterase